MTFRRPRRCSAISTIGATVVCWTASTIILSVAAPDFEGREASPTAVVILTQSVKTSGKRRYRGYDACGKKIKGRKRHIVTGHAWSTDRIDGSRRRHPGSRWRADRAHDPSVTGFPGCATFSPMVEIRRRRKLVPPSTRSARGRSKSSSAPTPRKASSCCRRALGGRADPSPGSGAVDRLAKDWEKSIASAEAGSSSPIPPASHAGSQGIALSHRVSSQTLGPVEI